MYLTKEKKEEIFNEFGKSTKDTGSAEAQIKKQIEFCTPSFLFSDTNPNKTKVMEDLFFILKH